MKNILFILFLLCIMPLSAQWPVDERASQAVTDSVFSKTLNANRTYSIYLPRGYKQNTDKKYPILYLLHGMWDTNKSWFERGHVKDVADLLIANGEADEMIIVTPNAGGDARVEWNGYFDMPGWNYETFFFTEFMPHIESKYRVISDRNHRAVAGLSMGGGGATGYAQRHPDKFGSAYAMSALMSIPEHGAVQGDPDSKIAILTRSVIDNSCVKYVLDSDEATKNKLRTVNWFVDCGDDDFLLDRNIEFFQAMRNNGIPCQFRVRDGGHVWEYWNSALYTCLRFVSRGFDK